MHGSEEEPLLVHHMAHGAVQIGHWHDDPIELSTVLNQLWKHTKIAHKVMSFQSQSNRYSIVHLNVVCYLELNVLYYALKFFAHITEFHHFYLCNFYLCISWSQNHI